MKMLLLGGMSFGTLTKYSVWLKTGYSLSSCTCMISRAWAPSVCLPKMLPRSSVVWLL